jgi:hypothetical protein
MGLPVWTNLRCSAAICVVTRLVRG